MTRFKFLSADRVVLDQGSVLRWRKRVKADIVIVSLHLLRHVLVEFLSFFVDVNDLICSSL